MNRRQFLATGAVFAAPPASIPILDTHIHLFDPTRKQGVPWPERNSPIYRPALPARFRAMATPFNVRGAIVIEASPWYEDNPWVLDVAARDPMMVAVIGNLDPGKPGFSNRLLTLLKSPLFRGLRGGNVWDRTIDDDGWTADAVADLRLVAQASLTFDVANPTPDLIKAALQLSDRIPTLRIVLDHLPSLVLPPSAVAARECRSDLGELARRKQVYAKLSAAIQKKPDGSVPVTPAAYKDFLDELVGLFGDDRVLFASDWPHSDLLRPYNDVVGLMRQYYAGRSQAAQEKFFWRNSQAAYRWSKREAAQAL